MNKMIDEYISKSAVLDTLDRANLMWYFETEGDYQELLKDIKRIPVADVQPLKHGQWVCEFYNDVFDVYQADCSVCKRESTNKYDKVSESYEYCPHCGAKMDLKDEDT